MANKYASLGMQSKMSSSCEHHKSQGGSMEHPMVAHTMLILAIQAGYPIMVRHPYHATNKPAKLSYILYFHDDPMSS